jgi:plastocyanin
MAAPAHPRLRLGKELVVPVAAIASAAVLAACGSTNTASTVTIAGSSGQAQAQTQTQSPVQPSSGQSSSAQPVSSSTSTAKLTAVTGSPAPSSSLAAGPATSLKLAANPDGELDYNTKQLTAKAGRVTITMTNMSPLEHNVTVARGSTVLGATPTFQDGSKSLTLNLKPGKYTFYCSVPGHRVAGMEGTLTVTRQ